MVDGLGETGIDALQAFATVAAVHAAFGFRASGGLVEAQFDLLEAAPAPFQRQLGHPGPGTADLVWRDGPVAGARGGGRRPPCGHVAALDVTQNRLGRFLAGGDGADGNPRAGLQIAPGEDPRALGGVSDRVDLDRAKAREGEAGDGFKGREIRALADGRDQLVAFDLKLAAGDGDGPLAAGGIRFGQLHADAAQTEHPAVPGHAGEVDLAQEVHALAHTVGLLARDPEVNPLVGPQSQVDRLVALAEELIDADIPAECGVELDCHTQVGDDLDFLLQDLARQPVSRDADPQHTARL